MGPSETNFKFYATTIRIYDMNRTINDSAEGYTMLEAIEEAKRCLHCKNPMCKKGCPISNDIPEWTRELSMGNLGNAMAIINAKSNLPAECAAASVPTSASVKATAY